MKINTNKILTNQQSMKRLLLSLVAAIVTLGVSLHAETVTITAAGLGLGDATDIATQLKDGITLQFEKGSNTNNAPKYYVTDKSARMYVGNTLSISAEGNIIKEIKFVFVKSSYDFGASDTFSPVTVGNYTETGKNGIWTGESIVPILFTANNKVRITDITVTYEPADPTALAAPVINVTGNEWEERTVTMSAEEGAIIYYTTGGEKPTTKSDTYTSPIKVTETTIFKAIAVKNGKTSSAASKEVKVDLYAPTFTPAGGTYTEAQTVTLKNSKTTDIWYTLDGNDPDKDNGIGIPYTSPIEVSANTIIKARAYNGNVKSAVATAEYAINATLETVTFDFKNFQESDCLWSGTDMPDSGNNGNKGWVVSQFDKDGVIIDFDNSAAENLKNREGYCYRLWYYKNAVQLRLATSGSELGSTMTFTAPEGRKITSIVFNGDNSVFKYTCNAGEIVKNGNIRTWTGAVTKVIFTPESFGKGNTMQLGSIDVTTVESYAPEFNYSSGVYFDPFEVKMTTLLTNAEIRYTLDGNTPTAQSTLYQQPVAIARPENDKPVILKAIAIGYKDGEPVTSEVTIAEYNWGEIRYEFGTVQDLYDFYTEKKLSADGKTYEYVNREYSEAVVLDFPVSVAAVSKNVLYIDDTFQLGGVNSIAVKSQNIDWTEYYKVGDELKEGMIVSWGWENVVTPVLTLRGNPVEVNPDYGAYVFEPEEATMSEVIESAAWNEEDIMYARIDQNSPMPMIQLLNPDLVSQCVLIKDVEFAKNTKANTGSTPNANFIGKSADGKSLKFITRLPISSYAAGTYDVTAVIAYDVKFTEEKIDKIGNITQEADTTITVVAYPVSMKAVQGGGEIEPGEGAVFEIAETVEAGDFMIVVNELAFAPLADNKNYGYMDAKPVKMEGDSAIADAGYALTLKVSDYVDAQDNSKVYYYMQDALGRYIYQTGNFNRFNVSTDMPENIAEASWYFEIINSRSNTPVVKITNAATDKYIQYSEQYGSYGCYPDEKGLMPSLYKAVDSTTGIEVVEGEAVNGPVEVYNLQGIRMGSTLEGLPAGLYIVRQGREVSKVIVR